MLLFVKSELGSPGNFRLELFTRSTNDCRHRQNQGAGSLFPVFYHHFWVYDAVLPWLLLASGILVLYGVLIGKYIASTLQWK